MKPVAAALAARGIPLTLVLSGQHPGLGPQEFGLEGFEALLLGCPGEEDPHRHVRAVTIALLPFLRAAPELIVVQGDTSSALGGALAGFSAGIPVAHVEAGLRTHDPMQPWPEEEYRAAIDAQADLLFAPTEISAANLRAEQVPGDVHVTGNTGIDAVLEAISRLPRPALREDRPCILVTCHRRESWRDGLRSIAAALRDLVADGSSEVDVILHPNRFVAEQMRRRLDGTPGVRLIEPCSHMELLQRMRGATLILSDSGGIQEEAPALGVPLLVLRDKTERPECLASGNARLVGTERTRIVGAAKTLLNDPAALTSMSRRALPFGDGRAAVRIADVIEQWLGRSGSRRLAG